MSSRCAASPARSLEILCPTAVSATWAAAPDDVLVGDAVSTNAPPRLAPRLRHANERESSIETTRHHFLDRERVESVSHASDEGTDRTGIGAPAATGPCRSRGCAMTRVDSRTRSTRFISAPAHTAHSARPSHVCSQADLLCIGSFGSHGRAYRRSQAPLGFECGSFASPENGSDSDRSVMVRVPTSVTRSLTCSSSTGLLDEKCTRRVAAITPCARSSSACCRLSFVREARIDLVPEADRS